MNKPSFHAEQGVLGLQLTTPLLRTVTTHQKFICILQNWKQKIAYFIN